MVGLDWVAESAPVKLSEENINEEITSAINNWLPYVDIILIDIE